MQEMATMKNMLISAFEMKDIVSAKNILGMEIKRKRVDCKSTSILEEFSLKFWNGRFKTSVNTFGTTF